MSFLANILVDIRNIYAFVGNNMVISGIFTVNWANLVKCLVVFQEVSKDVSPTVPRLLKFNHRALFLALYIVTDVRLF